jgi:hypothetical protein
MAFYVNEWKAKSFSPPIFKIAIEDIISAEQGIIKSRGLQG